MGLVWRDEFDGKSLDSSKWEVEVNADGGGNEELQIYTDRSENVRVSGGNLIIEAWDDDASVGGVKRKYSSGRIRTKYKGDWKYGRIVVRAKMPSGQGIWPAIWMLPTHERYGGWAASGEIDIMEMKGQNPKEVHGTLHYGGPCPRNHHETKSKISTSSFAEDFHDFEVKWQEGKIEWLVDGQLYQTQTGWGTTGGEFPAPFDQEFHLILNVAVGGNFVGSPDRSTRFPCRMIVEYVRVYQ